MPPCCIKSIRIYGKVKLTMGRFLDNKKPLKYDADVIVIGSGSGGSVALQTLASHGLKVILVEQDKLGGDCANSSCIPTKALLQTASTIKTIQASARFGVKDPKYSVNLEDVKHWVNKAIRSTGVNNVDNYSGQNIGVVKGHAHFISPYTISVGLKRLSAKKFIVASGASLHTPDISGLEDVKYLTYKNVLDIKKIPNSVAIIGGGSVGYEYAQIFEAFGSKVHIFEAKNHLLPDNDSEVGDLAESVLSSSGVRVHTLSNVTALKKSAKSIIVEHKNHGQTHKISVDTVMLATGNEPNVDIGLENARVTYSDDGIKVNALMQTNQKHIFAIGDVTGANNSASSSIKQGQIAAHNIIHRKKHKFSSNRAVPHVTFGEPEIATVGITEHQMRLTGRMYQSSIAPIGIVGRSYTSDYQSGFVKIIASHTGIILGASIVAPHAGELISELSIAVQNHIKACDISNTIHPFSTWSEATRVAASKIYCI